jgi:hypothetical protein
MKPAIGGRRRWGHVPAHGAEPVSAAGYLALAGETLGASQVNIGQSDVVKRWTAARLTSVERAMHGIQRQRSHKASIAAGLDRIA